MDLRDPTIKLGFEIAVDPLCANWAAYNTSASWLNLVLFLWSIKDLGG